MNVRATAKFVGTSSRKVGLVASLIRGRGAQDAVGLLQRTPQRASDPVSKVLGSAIANAENNYNLSAKNLVVESVLVGPAPTLKRFRPRAKGAASSIRKRASHITIVLADNGSSKPKETNAKPVTEKLESSDSNPETNEKEAK